jgi:predicted CopG family antitoxin
MLRELTINVEETLYNTLLPMVEKQTIGDLLNEFVQTRRSHRTYTQAELEESYRAMSADEEYEREAMEWCEGMMNGVDDETR